MRKSICHKIAGTVIVSALAFGSAQSQINDLSSPIILPSSSSSYNQNGFNLPTQPHVSGQDMIRGPSGITCQSAIGSNGPKLDMGMIGSNDIFNRETLSFYGRVSVPLGKKTKRVDCTKLYDLEISRLKMELQLMRAGAMPGMMDQRAARQVITQLPPAEAQPTEAASPRTPLVIGAKPQNTAQLKPQAEAGKPVEPKAAVTTYTELTKVESRVERANFDIPKNTIAKPYVKENAGHASNLVLASAPVKFETTAEKDTKIITPASRKTVSFKEAKIPHIETVIPRIADRRFIKTKAAKVSLPQSYEANVSPLNVSPLKGYEMVYACNSMRPNIDGVGIALPKNSCGKIFVPQVQLH